MAATGEPAADRAPSSAAPRAAPPNPSLATRINRRARRELLRTIRNPFPRGTPRQLVVHCGHHKAGTVWFRQVLLSIIGHYGLRQQEGKADALAPATDLAFYAHAGSFRPDQVGARPFRGSHLVRDPRDLVVSGYEYHRVCHEAWTRRPYPAYGGLGYQDYLHSLDEHDGLMAEIQWMSTFTAAEMSDWDYHQPQFLELRYEEAMADEGETFSRLFRWYGFDEAAVALGLEAVDRLSLRRGGAIPRHARSGRPGEWQDRLAPDHIDRFKELTGDLTVHLGYETDPGW
jgi:hypothetical protein